MADKDSEFVFGIGENAKKKVEVLKKIESDKENGHRTRVIDFGGGKEKHYPNKFNFINCVVDFKHIEKKGLKSISGSLEQESVYKQLDDEIKKHGKYDFSLCTHTLEDLNNPIFVAEKIEKYSNAGLITFPSKYAELDWIEKFRPRHRGYYHHRYIGIIKNNSILFIPKTPVLESHEFNIIGSKHYHGMNEEVWILWRNKIPIEVHQSGWCGPSIDDFSSQCYNLLLISDEDEINEANKSDFKNKKRMELINRVFRKLNTFC